MFHSILVKDHAGALWGNGGGLQATPQNGGFLWFFCLHHISGGLAALSCVAAMFNAKNFPAVLHWMLQMAGPHFSRVESSFLFLLCRCINTQ